MCLICGVKIQKHLVLKTTYINCVSTFVSSRLKTHEFLRKYHDLPLFASHESQNALFYIKILELNALFYVKSLKFMGKHNFVLSNYLKIICTNLIRLTDALATNNLFTIGELHRISDL